MAPPKARKMNNTEYYLWFLSIARTPFWRQFYMDAALPLLVEYC